MQSHSKSQKMVHKFICFTALTKFFNWPSDRKKKIQKGFVLANLVDQKQPTKDRHFPLKILFLPAAGYYRAVPNKPPSPKSIRSRWAQNMMMIMTRLSTIFSAPPPEDLPVRICDPSIALPASSVWSTQLSYKFENYPIKHKCGQRVGCRTLGIAGIENELVQFGDYVSNPECVFVRLCLPRTRTAINHFSVEHVKPLV